MATSDSEDFESADEDFQDVIEESTKIKPDPVVKQESKRGLAQKGGQTSKDQSTYPCQVKNPVSEQKIQESHISQEENNTSLKLDGETNKPRQNENTLSSTRESVGTDDAITSIPEKRDKSPDCTVRDDVSNAADKKDDKFLSNQDKSSEVLCTENKNKLVSDNSETQSNVSETIEVKDTSSDVVDNKGTDVKDKEVSGKPSSRRREHHQQRKPKESKIGAKKLGARVSNPTPVANVEAPHTKEDVATKEDEVDRQSQADHKNTSSARAPEEIASVFDKLSAKSSEEKQESGQSYGWGWGGWGSSLLSSATASVTTLTSHVTQGINTVMETVEGGLGAPDPEELARQDLAAMKIADIKEPTPPEEEVGASGDTGPKDTVVLFPLGQLMSGVSQLGKIVESTGAKVLTGGLDTLEVIGKKTMEVLQEGDPGLKKKRALFQPDKPILSQVLREAKNQAEEDAKLQEEKQAARKVHFETLFDDYQGLIHLEALEMLSRQCEMKLQSALLQVSGEQLQDLQSKLHGVRDECLLPDPDDVVDEPSNHLEESLTSAFASLPVDVNSNRIIKVWNEVKDSAEVCPEKEEDESKRLAALHQKAISALAQLTAICVEQFHRTGELLLVLEPRDPKKEAAQLMQITLLESSMIEHLASIYCESLNTLGDAAQPIITKVFLEASNSSTYIQDAFQLLVPVLQVGTV